MRISRSAPRHRHVEIVSARHESWPLAQPFVISRGAKVSADVVCVMVSDGTFQGLGECVPYGRYGETVDGVLGDLRAFGGGAIDRDTLRRQMPAGAARNALDCALWDLEAKRGRGQSGEGAVAVAAGGVPHSIETAFTLSLGSPQEMGEQARLAVGLRVLKLKLGGDGDAARIKAVRAARGDVRLLIDANEAWREANVRGLLQVAVDEGVDVVEQPLPAGGDSALRQLLREFGDRIAICADESVHTREDFGGLADRYNAVNIKLDKAGGLTEGLDCMEAARVLGFRIMVGSMVGTSLSMAPAMTLARTADWADLDSPLLLAKDRPHALTVEAGFVSAPTPALWG